MKKENPSADMEDEDYLANNFPPCMTKKALVSAIKEYEGAFEHRSRSALVNQLETIILFHIRCERNHCPLNSHPRENQRLHAALLLPAGDCGPQLLSS